MTIQLPEAPAPITVWALEVDVSATESPQFVRVKGMNNFTPTINNTTQDASTFDSEGWGADAVTQRKWQCSGGLIRSKKTPRDAGQEALRSAFLAGEMIHVRFHERLPGGEAYEGYALVQWEPQGGDATALNTVNFTLLGQGERLTITNPTPTPTPPTPPAGG